MEELSLFIATYLFLNVISIIGVQLYLMLILIPKVYKHDNADYQRLIVFFVDIKPLPLLDSISRYVIPFYGVFMSFYLVYLLHFDDDTKRWKLSSRLKYAERKLQKFRIFKRKDT